MDTATVNQNNPSKQHREMATIGQNVSNEQYLKTAAINQSVLSNACDWCPRTCLANRADGQVGVCGADSRLIVARAALHFWEEPPISGETGSGTVFFGHCPLHCVYCQNALIAAGNQGIAISIERLAQIFIELQRKGALNINMVTPSHYTYHIIEALKIARQGGSLETGECLELPVVWNTSGYETTKTIEALAGWANVYLVDFKYARRSTAQAYSHAADYPEIALRAIDEMVAQIDSAGGTSYDEYRGQQRMTRGVIVRHLILPGHIEESYEALKLLYDRYGNTVKYSIMNQYTPVIDSDSALAARYPQLLERVSSDDYDDILTYADDLGIDDYYWQEGKAATESFIPAFDNTGVLAQE